MAEPAFGTSVTAEIISSLPQAVDPFALSLNESPFPPLPAVRSALDHCLDVANRYPEFLPGQLRRMIADRVGVDEDQVVLGPGASGVAVQVLHAVTRPGDRIVMSTPTFDGYPIFAEMARLTQVTVPLDRHGYQDLAAMAEAAADARVVVLCRPHRRQRRKRTLVERQREWINRLRQSSQDLGGHRASVRQLSHQSRPPQRTAAAPAKSPACAKAAIMTVSPALT